MVGSLKSGRAEDEFGGFGSEVAMPSGEVQLLMYII